MLTFMIRRLHRWCYPIIDFLNKKLMKQDVSLGTLPLHFIIIKMILQLRDQHCLLRTMIALVGRQWQVIVVSQTGNHLPYEQVAPRYN